MTRVMNETHDPVLTSWVESANTGKSDFPVQNLPFGIFRRSGTDEPFRAGVAIGDLILDLTAAADSGAFADEVPESFDAARQPTLKPFMALGARHWSEMRLALSRALRSGSPKEAVLRRCLIAQSEAEYAVPAHIGDYTDFYTSIFHATNVGKLFRPDNPLLPNYKWVPIAYHGRASTIGISGHTFRRPQGQTFPPGSIVPTFGPSQRLDYELELGIYIGTSNKTGVPITLEDAEEHVFGVSLFNDWSARDMQAWEYQPLGPFLSKNFASTISPWIVTLEALAPYRTSLQRAPGDPEPLPYLDAQQNRATGAFDIALEVFLKTPKMSEQSLPAAHLSQSNFKHSYWTIAQMVAHHTVNGCALRPGDLFGSGTQSGPLPGEAGSLLELSAGGTQPVTLGNGEVRTFLEDGDTVIFRGYCTAPNRARIGFGECLGTVFRTGE